MRPQPRAGLPDCDPGLEARPGPGPGGWAPVRRIQLATVCLLKIKRYPAAMRKQAADRRRPVGGRWDQEMRGRERPWRPQGRERLGRVGSRQFLPSGLAAGGKISVRDPAGIKAFRTDWGTGEGCDILAGLGSGDPLLEKAISGLARRHPEQVAVKVGYDTGLAHRI